MKRNNVLWGILLIIVGVLVLLNVLDIVNVNLLFEGWWTLFIIVPSFIGILKDNDKSCSVIFFVFGILLLLGVRDILDFNLIWKLFLPIVLIIIGISIIFKDKISSKVKKEIKNISKSDKVYTSVFSGQDLNFGKEEFNGCELNAIFGGLDCDIRNVKIKDDVVITAFAAFGGVSIYVPKNVTIKVVSNSIFGGVGGDYNKNITDDNKTIYIKATCLFGGIDINDKERKDS